MKNDEIKKLAKLTVEGKKVDREIATYVLDNLSRKDLIFYLRYIKSLTDKNTVKIISGNPLPSEIKRSLIRKYADKEVLFEEDKKMGDGIKAIIGDTIIDLSTRGYVSEVVENLKQNI